jgi:hypothetical protein
MTTRKNEADNRPHFPNAVPYNFIYLDPFYYDDGYDGYEGYPLVLYFSTKEERSAFAHLVRREMVRNGFKVDHLESDPSTSESK